MAILCRLFEKLGDQTAHAEESTIANQGTDALLVPTENIAFVIVIVDHGRESCHIN